jgi:predicted RNase H-related nuclease YkuK (DUF458 family)
VALPEAVMNIEEVKQFIRNTSQETNVYLGADSERINVDGVWYADYTLAVVIHINGNNGCKVFGDVIRERDYDQRVDKPSMRLMGEVYKVADLFQELADAIEDRYVEVHLDINPKKDCGSSIVVQQAVGYIKGTCNLNPYIKPRAFAATYAADRMKHILAS